MKLYLSFDELKTIRDALYTKVNNIKADMDGKDLKPNIRAFCEEEIAENEKLLAYVNELLRAEPI